MFHRTTLAACPSCSCQFFTNEPACPHCGAAIRAGDGRGLQRAAASLVLGLAVAAVPLAACGDDTGGATSGGGGGSGPTSTSDGTSDATSDTTSTASSQGGAPTTSSSSSDSGTDNTSVSAYGTPASVDSSSSADSSSSSDSASSSDSSSSSGTGGGDPGVCAAEVVADEARCDEACDGNVENVDTGNVACSIQCLADEDCSDDGTIVCIDFGNATSCMFDCSGDNFCPSPGYVCDQDFLICLPD